MAEAQATDLTRRLPAQQRARQTVETILQATAQILVEDGSDRLTTNHLAKKAGFSIGTIYQYFPNREAIVLALIERQREQVRQRVEAVLRSARDGTAEDGIRRIVRVLHESFNLHRLPERRLAQALIRLAAAQGLPTPPNVAVQAIVQIWMENQGTEARPLSESETFVLTRSVIEVLRQATLQASPLLGTPEFEEALVRLLLGFLREPGK